METAPFDTFFTCNKAKDDKGGAIYATEYINAVNTVFGNNSARVDGGAAYAGTNINVRHAYLNPTKQPAPHFHVLVEQFVLKKQQ